MKLERFVDVWKPVPAIRDRLGTVTMGILEETWREIPAFRSHRMADGAFESVHLAVTGPHEVNPEVVAIRDTQAFVEALVFHHLAGTDVLAPSSIITKPDYAAIFGGRTQMMSGSLQSTGTRRG